MSEFEQNLQSLLAKEASAGHGDADRLGAMVEQVARGLGFTVAIACRGDQRAIDEMMAGAEGYAHSEAVSKAPFARFMSQMKGSSQ